MWRFLGFQWDLAQTVNGTLFHKANTCCLFQAIWSCFWIKWSLLNPTTQEWTHTLTGSVQDKIGYNFQYLFFLPSSLTDYMKHWSKKNVTKSSDWVLCSSIPFPKPQAMAKTLSKNTMQMQEALDTWAFILQMTPLSLLLAPASFYLQSVLTSSLLWRW